MKTIIIWTDFQDVPEFLVFDGDLSRFGDIFINSSSDQALQDELNDLVFDEEGNKKIEFLGEFPVHEVRPDTIVINAGFIP